MPKKISWFMKTFSKNEDGATAIEYGLIAALIAVIITAAVILVGQDLGNMFNQVANNI